MFMLCIYVVYLQGNPLANHIEAKEGKDMKRRMLQTLVFVLVLSMVLPFGGLGGRMGVANASGDVANFTILHTNDFHGSLEAKSGATTYYPSARVASKVKDVRTSVGAENVLLFDGGDLMQGTLLSNLKKGEPTIAYYKALGYNAAAFGNHEFDWGQSVLQDRVTQAADTTGGANGFPFLAANITTKGTDGSCTSWAMPSFVKAYQVFNVGPADAPVKVGVIGVSSVETPYITVSTATTGLCFKDPTDSIVHYYDEVKAKSDVLVVLSHIGYNDGGYGYGITNIYGDKTLAGNLNTAQKPVDLIIGGHSHTNLLTLPTPQPTGTKIGNTLVVQAANAGKQLGRADFTYTRSTNTVAIAWSVIDPTVNPVEDPAIKSLIQSYTNDPVYQGLINQEIGYSQVNLLRYYNGDNMMSDFINDAIYGQLNSDTVNTTKNVDMVFNNAGGIRTSICAPSVVDCPTNDKVAPELAPVDTPYLLKYQDLFNVMPFGNQTITGDMTGAQILDLLNQSATLFKGALQVSGIKFSFYRYTDQLNGATSPTTWAWGAYDVKVLKRGTTTWEDLDLTKTYRVGTNEFLAPAGGDGYTPFKYMSNISYWGDMLDITDSWVTAHYTQADPYEGPVGGGTLDNRVTRVGTDSATDPSSIVVPLTVLHHNDSHGRLLPTYKADGTTVQYPGYDQLATLIKQERLHNPDRTLLLNGGDTIQGDSMMYYFKNAGNGKAPDGTALPADLSMNPLIKAMNAMNYDAMTLGNHEFNFGSEIFKTLKQATFPLLGANVTDGASGNTYGLTEANVKPFVEKTISMGTGNPVLRISILGITNHRVPNYELPSNIMGLTFQDPIQTGKNVVPQLRLNNDVVIALTHIGFTTNPKSVEVDANVDTAFAAQVAGVDTIVGAHSHTDPAKPEAPYKYLPTIIGGPSNAPVMVTQALRYNNDLGEVIMGVVPDGAGHYKVVSRAGKYLVVPNTTVEDPAIKAIAAPYKIVIDAYNATTIGQTVTPIDTMNAFTQETNGANLQADAAVWKLQKELGVTIDVHLSGAMTNKLVATTATPAAPYTLTVADMFAAMPYENSLLVLRMNGPQLKAVLERAYRNYYYYKYVPGYGGYSYYTTCMIDTNSVGQIQYTDMYPTLPDGHNVIALKIGGKAVDFTDATKMYTVSTVNYLAAGSCNFSDNGVSLWPLNQLVADTQYYVRDAVVEYVKDQTTKTGAPINPKIENRLDFLSIQMRFPLLFR